MKLSPQQISSSLALLFAITLAESALAESPALVRDARIKAVQTFQGSVNAQLTPVTSARPLTILILSDTLTDADILRVRKELAATLTTAFLAAHPLQIVALSGGSGDFSTPLINSDQLIALAKQITAGQRVVEPLIEMETLSAVVPNFPGGWAHTIIVGRLPFFVTDEKWVSAWMSELCRKQKSRVSFWSTDGNAPAWAQNVAAGSMGMVATGGFNALLPMLKDSTALFEISWETKPSKGAVLYDAQFKNEAGEGVATLTALGTASGFALQLRQYLTARAQTGDDAAQQILALNPSDPEALRQLATRLSAQNNFQEAAVLWRTLNEISPLDGAGWAAIGKAAYTAGDFAQAEDALKHASDLNVKDAYIFEMQAQLHLKRNDYEGALPLLDAALQLSPKQQALWLLRADCAKSLKRQPLEINSLEHARESADLPQDRSHDLILAYLANNEAAKALEELRRSKDKTPLDSASLMEYAGLWQRVNQPAEAEKLWLQAIKMEPKAEAAYVALVANYTTAGRTADAARIAEEGLAKVPTSSPLLLAKEQALEETSRYEARRFLSSLNTSQQSLPLLKRRAALEDIYGGQSSAAYADLLNALVVDSAPQSEVVEVSRRGLLVSLREEHYDMAKVFADKLAAAGERSGQAMLTSEGKRDARAALPGGADALHFLLFDHGKGDPARIMLDAAREFAQMPSNTAEGRAALQHLASNYHEYFQRVANLITLGEKKGNKYLIELSLADKDSRHRTEKAFEVLGLKLHRDKEGVELKSAEGKSQRKKQDTLAALEIDEQSIEESLAQGKKFSLEIPYEDVTVFPAEEEWRKAFYANEHFAGGLAEAIATDQKVARLYLGLNSIDRAAANALLHAANLKVLAERFSVQMWLYSPALALKGAAAEVPGGAAANPVWANLAAADPANGAAFLEALMNRDQGRLLAFFYTLSQLDPEHQRFFTRTPQRAKRFYDLFRESQDMRRGAEVRLGESAFVQFLREVPLNDNLAVDFPGSPEVWMVAKGVKSSVGSVAKLTRKMKQSAAPDDEDQILIRLAGTANKSGGREQSELANFVAVARIDAERKNPLDPESALLLAQGYLTHKGLFPYLTELGDLDLSDYQKLLSLENGFAGLDQSLTNLRLGELHAFLATSCAAHQSGLWKEEDFIALFRKTLQRYIEAKDAVSWTSASLGFVSALAKSSNVASVDAAVRNVLTAGAAPQRASAFGQVLALQKVPSLDALLSIDHNLELIGKDPKVFDEIQKTLEQLAVLDIPKDWKLTGEYKKMQDMYDNAGALKIVDRLRRESQVRHKNDRDLLKMVAEIRARLEPWVELALVGRVYARYLDPGDLLVSEDLLLLRKHEFIQIGPHSGKLDWFPRADLLISNGGQGTYFIGSLGDFVMAAGHARSAGNHLGGNGGEYFAAALISSVRGTNWQGLNETALSAFAATIRLAREWIVESAASDEMRAELEENSRGVISLSRSRTVIDALQRRDWPSVWSNLTVSDLHFLGDELAERAPESLWRLPQLKAMKDAARHDTEAAALGSIAPDLSGCPHPHLRRFEPYEEYIRHERPEPLSQRLAELKIDLAWMADSSAWPPEKLIRLTEPAADEMLVRFKMHDMWDWGGAVDAYHALKLEDMEQLLVHQ